MAQLFIKTEKPFIEKKIFAKGSTSTFISIGVKVYSDTQLNEIRKSFDDTSIAIKLPRWQRELEDLKYNTDISEEDIDSKVSEINSKIESAMESSRVSNKKFCLDNVLYIKNASLAVEEDNKVTDLIISDTREAKPIESLWETPEECLAVLLDMYLDSPSFKDSLQKTIFETVFGTGDATIKDAKVKN